VSVEERPLIVYVEDDPDTFKVACQRLHSRYRLIWAQNDREAVDLLAHYRLQLFAIVMDIELRGSKLDGLDLTRLLRGHSLAKSIPDFARRLPLLPRVPIIVLTAYTARYTEADARAVGATHLATKPIDFTRLNLALAQSNVARVIKRLSSDSQGSLDMVPATSPAFWPKSGTS
jgi:CheY-like chemotaxis protein